MSTQDRIDDQAVQSRAFALLAEGRYQDALDEFRSIARQYPHNASVLNNLATAYSQVGCLPEAMTWFEKAIAIDPGLAQVHVNVANLLHRLQRPLEAAQRFRDIARKFPHDVAAQFAAGDYFYTQGLRDEARAAFDHALALDPDHARARWMQLINTLPQAYGPGDEPAQCRGEFAHNLHALRDWFNSPRRQAAAATSVSERQPFYLAFMEESNRELLSEYGDLCAHLMRDVRPVPPSPPLPGPPAGPVRLAIVSGHLYDQSVWTALLRGLCAQLDRGLVELHLLSTGKTHDRETDLARSYAKSFVAGTSTVEGWISALARIDPHVILYTEIGMDSTSARLAAMRLAPVQLVSWGHPETSGYPTLDYYLSAAAFEPEGAQVNYREKLVTLPGVGCYYDDLVPDFVGIDWAALGVDPYAPRLLCAGTCYKYLPKDDALLVEIARRVPGVQLLFFHDSAPALSTAVEGRLQRAFTQAGLDAGRSVRFLPRQSRPAFFGMLRDCDALLDTVGFSGFNTAMQAIECELPVVAWEGKFMRGRLASGALRAIGMDELVATTPEQYVGLAARLATDGTYRLKVADRLAQRKEALLRDLAPVRAFERFLVEATGRSKA